MKELSEYRRFQKAVFESAEEGCRLDAMAEKEHIPHGRCPSHPQIVVSNGMFDGVCPLCESKNDEGCHE